MKLIIRTLFAANILTLNACAFHLYESVPVPDPQTSAKPNKDALPSSESSTGKKLLRYNLIEPMVFIKLEPDGKDGLKYKVTLEPKNKKIVAYNLYYKENYWYKDDIEATIDKSLVLSTSDTTSTPQYKEVIETVGELVGKGIKAAEVTYTLPPPEPKEDQPTPLPFDYTLSPCRKGSGLHSLEDANKKLSEWKKRAKFPEEVLLEVLNQEVCQDKLFKLKEDKVCFNIPPYGDSCSNNNIIKGIIGYDGTNIDVAIKKKVAKEDAITLASLSITVPSTPQIYNPKRHLLIPEKEKVAFNDGIITSRKVTNESVVKGFFDLLLAFPKAILSGIAGK